MPLQEPGFEKAIDANPLDSLTHLAYADWLDDHSEHDEAAFRRNIGTWIKEEGKYAAPNKSSTATWITDNRHLPDGVREHLIPWRELAFDRQNPWIEWGSYRIMEEGLRRAFMKGRQQPEQLVRKLSARRYARRRYVFSPKKLT